MTKQALNLNQIRTDYQKGTLSANEAGDDPVVFFEQWLQEAIEARASEVNAMSLSTVGADKRPHSRIVLLKGIEEGAFCFFTNYQSAKGQQIMAHPEVAALFFWKELERQVRIEGKVEKLSPEASDKYFYSRPVASRISAIASPQSQPVDSRSVLEEKVKALAAKKEEEIIRPEHWGGFKIIPDYIEFWQGRHSRLHDRLAFSKEDNGKWKKQRLAP